MRSRFTFLTALIAIALSAQSATAQLPHTRLYSIFPPGAQSGTTVDVTVVNGADIDELDALHFSDPGIRATRKMNGDKPVANQFIVSVDQYVRPGIHEVRAAGLFGVSNPRAFVVGHQTEATEVEPNANTTQATPIQINTAINANIGSATDVDFYAFDGKKDQQLTVDIAAQAIDSKLAAMVEVMSADGRRVAKIRSTDHKDPQIGIKLPDDGRYFVKVHDSSFRGGPTFAYRLRIHTDPSVDFILPNCGVAGTRSTFTLFGRNLGGTASTFVADGQPLEKLDVDITLPLNAAAQSGRSLSSHQADVDGFEWAYKNSNLIFIQLSSSIPVIEAEPNNSGSEAQRITVPGDVTGQFGASHDKDYFEFEIKEPRTESLFIEVFGHRSGSSADPVLQVEQITKNDKGEESAKRLTSLDDGKNPFGNNFQISTRDPRYELKAPKPGIYRVIVHDRYFESRGDCRLTYRLAIRNPQPDFRVVAFPATPAAGNTPAGTSGLTLRRGDNLAIEVLALRNDGFNETIDIEADGLPTGVTAGAAVIPAGKTTARLILTAKADAPITFTNIRIVGKTKQRTRYARSATITWTGNQNEANRARLTSSIGLSVMKDEQRFQPVANASVLEVNQSRQILIPVDLLKRSGFDAKVTFAFTGQPKNVDVENKALDKGKSNGIFRVFIKPNAPEGTSLVYLNATGQVSYPRNPWKVEREKVTQAQIVAQVAAADASIKKSTEEQAKTSKTITDLDTVYRTSLAAKETANKTVVELTTAMNAVKQENDKAATSLAATQSVLQATQTSLKSITEQDANAEIESLKQALKSAVVAAQTAVTQSTTVQKAAQSKLAAATATLTTATKAAQEATATATANEQAINAAKQKLGATQKAIADANAAKKAAEAAKKAADKRVTDATNAAKPKNVNVTVPSTPFVLTIRKAPVQLTASVPNGGNIKRGAKIDVKVTIKRQHGFAGVVKVQLPLPAGVSDLSAAPLEIAADKTEGVLSITAGPNATEGQLPNLVVQALMDFNGQVGVDRAAVDAPIALKVAK